MSACRAQLYCSTWTRDSHGLFDYESNYTVDVELSIDSACKIVRNESLSVIKEDSKSPRPPAGEASVRLANVAVRGGKLWVFDPLAGLREPAQEQLWLVLRNYLPDAPESGFKLQLGDVIRFGKCAYAIKELVNEPAVLPEPALEQAKRRQLGSHIEAIRTECEVQAAAHDESCIELVGKGEQDDRSSGPLEGVQPRGEANRCRICLGTDSREPNPLISLPCKCIGTVELIHVACFQQWMRSKVTVQQSPYVSAYSWTPFECDVCKQKFPGIVLVQGRCAHGSGRPCAGHL